MNRKGQFGSVLGLLTVGVILLIMTVVFSSVFANTGNAETSYSTGITAAGANITTTLTGRLPIVSGTVVITNCTAGQTLTGTGDDHDYTLNLGTGNLTLVDRLSNINTSCQPTITYRIDRGINDVTSQLIQNTTYQAIDLVTVGLIILAAVMVVGLIFLMGRRA